MRKDVNNFLDHWPSIRETLKEKDILLFLDYDGTLTPIAERPELATLYPGTKEVLEKLITFFKEKGFVQDIARSGE